MIEIWHNPSCSKSRAALAEVESSGEEFVVRRYLDDSPSAAEITDVVERLRVEPWEIARTADATKLGVTLPAKDAGQRDAWIAVLAAQPRLIQRPILTSSDGTTVVGRDAESLARLFAGE